MFGLLATQKQRIYLFYQANHRRIAAFLYSLGARRPEDIEELMHEVFVDLIESWSSLKSEDAILSWCFTVAKRKYFRLCDHKRRRGCDEFNENVHCGSDDPERSVLFQGILRAIAKQKPIERQLALRKFFIEEFTSREISEELRIPISTITTWCSRFRESLSQQLEAEQAAHPTNVDLALGRE